MPEGDTIFRGARTLNRALAGKTVKRFESAFPTHVRNIDPLTQARSGRANHVLVSELPAFAWRKGERYFSASCRVLTCSSSARE